MSKIPWWKWTRVYKGFGLKFHIRYSEVKNRIFCSLRKA